MVCDISKYKSWRSDLGNCTAHYKTLNQQKKLIDVVIIINKL